MLPRQARQGNRCKCNCSWKYTTTVHYSYRRKKLGRVYVMNRETTHQTPDRHSSRTTIEIEEGALLESQGGSVYSNMLAKRKLFHLLVPCSDTVLETNCFLHTAWNS